MPVESTEPQTYRINAIWDYSGYWPELPEAEYKSVHDAAIAAHNHIRNLVQNGIETGRGGYVSYSITEPEGRVIYHHETFSNSDLLEEPSGNDPINDPIPAKSSNPTYHISAIWDDSGEWSDIPEVTFDTIFDAESQVHDYIQHCLKHGKHDGAGGYVAYAVWDNEGDLVQHDVFAPSDLLNETANAPSDDDNGPTP